LWSQNGADSDVQVSLSELRRSARLRGRLWLAEVEVRYGEKEDLSSVNRGATATNCDFSLKAVLIDTPGGLRITEVPKPKAAPGEVLVKLRCCGICGTDLEKVHGHGITSRILGHEEAGEIAEVGEGVEHTSVGDRVYAHHHVPCGTCELCRRGEETFCAEYSKHNLVPCGLAEYFIVPSFNVERGAILKLPESLGFEEASFIEPLACCVRGLERANAKGARSVVIYGAGPVGLLHLKLLKGSYGVGRASIADVSDYRLSVAAGMGADVTFNVGDEGQRERARRSLDYAPELVVLATGSASALEDAMNVVGRAGTVLLFGAPRKDATATINAAHLFLNGTKLVTSYAATERETNEALRLLAEKKIQVMDMVTHRFPLAAAADAFAVAERQQCMKALIVA
jgi:L-iditol 2-dehydrogenase